ncbi:hypothetical protein GQ600_9908 [Phytophthora cactorum]|nr:hypothetical protein GQ600_9908 [Phytophthora cactorum]
MTSFVTGTYAQSLSFIKPQQDSEPSYVAGSHMLTLWSQPSDVGGAIAQFGGVQECSEHVNARVDSEFFEGDLLSSCKQEAAGYDVKELLQPLEAIVAPSEEQTTRLCRAESCAAWLSQAAEATWLPECRYRQSQMSFRSLAETLLRIREDLVATGMSGAVIAPNASLFREFYELNQLSNLLNAKENTVNEVGSPVMVARQLSAQEDFSLMGSGDNPQLSAAVEPPGSSSGTTEKHQIEQLCSLSTSNSASVSSGSSSSSNSTASGMTFCQAATSTRVTPLASPAAASARTRLRPPRPPN